MASKKQTNTDSLPDYLKDLKSSGNVYDREEYSYLQGLPIRPTKRRRFVPQGESCSGSAADASCLSPPGSGEFVVADKGYLSKSVICISSLAFVIGAAVLLWRQLIIPDEGSSNTSRRKKKRKGAETSIVVDSDTGSVEVIQNTVATPLEAQLKTSEASDGINERNDCIASLNRLDNELQITTVESSCSSVPTCQPSTDTQNNHAADNSIVSLQHSSGEEKQLIAPTIIPPIEQLAQRWESRGLDRQKSLELAAHFEMNMLFFRELQHFLAMAACNLMNRFDLMHSVSLDQVERHQEENINLSYQEKRRMYQKQIAYMVVNTSVLTRCVVVAIASKFYFSNERSSVSVSDAMSTIFHTFCPECTESSNEEGQQVSLIPLYGFEYLSQFMGTISCTLVCSIKSVWYASLLAFCHQYISRSLSCSIVALVFIDWENFFQLGVAVVALNICLTMLMCRYIEVKAKRLGIRDAAQHYEQCASFCEVILFLPPVLVGFYFSL